MHANWMKSMDVKQKDVLEYETKKTKDALVGPHHHIGVISAKQK